MQKKDLEKFAEAIIAKLGSSVKTRTLEEFCNEYKAYVKSNRAAKTYEGVALVSKKLLSYFSPVRTIDTITLKDAEDFLDSLKKTAPKAVYNYHRVLRAMFNKAVQWNYLSSNIFEKIKLPKRQFDKPFFITETELHKIIGCVMPAVVRRFVITAFYTGCRLGELVNLKWENVNLKENILVIGDKNFTTKTRKQRIVPIHPRVTEVFIQILNPEKQNNIVILNSFQDLISKRSLSAGETGQHNLVISKQSEDPDLPTGKAGLSGHHPTSVISKRSGDPDLPTGKAGLSGHHPGTVISKRSGDPGLSGHHPGTVILNSFQDLNSKRSEDPDLPTVKAGLSGHQPSPFVFSKSNGHPYTTDYFSRNFKRACRKAGIDESIHFHSLRHSAATGMINKGAPVPSVQKILGHANIQTTMLYTHPDLNSLRDAISRL